MSSGFWEQVVADGLRVPVDRSLIDMTEELTRMLGSPDPGIREAIAFPTLATWIDDGVYDDLLVGLGDGMTHGLDYGLGLANDDSVFRRSYSALVLTECIDRSTRAGLGGPDVVLRWGDRVMGWLAREQDHRALVDGRGWAHAIAHGADALAALARSPFVGRLELTVILDVIGDRLLSPGNPRWSTGEGDRLALATMQVLLRNVVELEVLEPWIARLCDDQGGGDETGVSHQQRLARTDNVQDYLRSLHLQLALGSEHPGVRTDLLLVLIAQLRRTNPAYFPTARLH